MLRAVPKHFLSRKYAVLDDGRELSVISVGWLSEKASTTIAGREMKLHREGFLRGAFQLDADGSVVAKAYKPSVFRNRYEIELADARLVMERPGLFSRSFVLRNGDEVIGRIERENIFTRKTRIDLPDDWPLPLQLFIFWLAVIIWNRMESSS